MTSQMRRNAGERCIRSTAVRSEQLLSLLHRLSSPIYDDRVIRIHSGLAPNVTKARRNVGPGCMFHRSPEVSLFRRHCRQGPRNICLTRSLEMIKVLVKVTQKQQDPESTNPSTRHNVVWRSDRPSLRGCRVERQMVDTRGPSIAR